MLCEAKEDAAYDASSVRQCGRKQHHTKKHLEDLGFVVSGTVTVVSEISGNLIVKVKDSRVAISREMAGKIMI